jgi:regulator of sigma E protease
MEYTVTPEKSDKGRFSIGVMPYISGVRVMKTLPGSAAAQAGLLPGDMIRSVDGRTVRIPDDFTGYVRERQGTRITLQVERQGRSIPVEAVPRLREEITVQLVENSRLKGKNSNVTIANGELEKIRKGISGGVVKINDNPVATYALFLDQVRRNRDQVLRITNGADSINGIFSYRGYGFLGVETGIVQDMVMVRYGAGESFIRAFTEPYEFIMMNLKGIGMLFSGQLNVRQNLSGPIFIAKIAGDVAYYRGLSSFIILMAQISIILMIMNLLPIPMVDGSYIVIFLIEAIRKKPLSNKVMERIQYFGMALLILLGVFIIFNDIMKIFFTQ